MTKSEIHLTRPDDWHIHLRDQDALRLTVPAVARYFGRAIVMPNLIPPVTTVEIAASYRQRILSHLPEGSGFNPLMTLYLTDSMPVDEIHRGRETGMITACKLYPAGATTNSDSGVTDLKKIYPVLETMQDLGMPLLVHGEVTTPEIDIFDREAVFIDRHLCPLLQDFPELNVVMEHITTADAAQFVEEGPKSLAATITAHHLLHERNHMLAGGIRPHLYCLPILKRRKHQEELIRVAISGNKKFFLGSDSAPHALDAKETACGCAGCYTGHATLELYAEVFDNAGALDKLEAFASFHGPDFYKLPRNTDKIILKQQIWEVEEQLPYLDTTIKPLRAGEQIHWIVESAQ
ncbi:MAG: dihydroorotase [Porticoccaceae bacterium]